MKKNISIVIPTYNEKENIKTLLGRIKKVDQAIKSKFSLNLLFVDDSSPDNTLDEINSLKKLYDYKITTISRRGKLGLGTAYTRGFQEAIKLKMDYVIQMDADLSHEPESIIEMTGKFQDYDVVIGSRYIKGASLPDWSASRKLISKLGNTYARIILGTKVHDYTGGFNAYSTEVLKQIDLGKIKSNGYSFQIEMKYKALSKGFRFIEVPIHFKDRTKGESKFNKKIFVEAFINTLKLKLGII